MIKMPFFRHKMAMIPPAPTYIPAHPTVAPYVDRFREICEQMIALHDRKGADYGGENDPYANVRASQEFGVDPWLGTLIRLNDKITRIKSFCRNGNLVNESLKDSIDDIGVYAVIMRVLYEEQHPELRPSESAQPVGIPLGGMQYKPAIMGTDYIPEWADRHMEEHLAQHLGGPEDADAHATAAGLFRTNPLEGEPEVEPSPEGGLEADTRLRHVLDSLSSSGGAPVGPGPEAAAEAPEAGEAEPPAGATAAYDESPVMCWCDMAPDKPHVPHLVREDLDDPELRLRNYVIQQNGLATDLAR